MLIGKLDIKEWTEPEVLEEKTEILGLKLFLCGVSSKYKDGTEITGSSVGLDDYERERAWMEYYERLSIVHAEKSGMLQFSDSLDKKCRYARSNGVAAHASVEAAKENSSSERIERDRVLRAWFGDAEVPVSLIDEKFCPDIYAIDALSGHFKFKLFELQEELKSSDIYVYGVFAIPSDEALPVYFGFGASEFRKTAIRKAVLEFLQRLAFTWGETMPECEFPASPMLHFARYFRPEGRALILEWLDQKKRKIPYLKRRDECKVNKAWLDITHPQLRDICTVVRCQSDGLLPLTFGTDHPFLEKNTPEDLKIHPMG